MSAMSSERREPRFRTRVRVRLHVFDGSSGELTLGGILEAESRDFAIHGLFLAGVSLKCATRVHLYLDLPSGCVEAFGVVVHGRPQVDAQGIARDGVGVRFTRISMQDEKRLSAFLGDRRDATRAALEAALARLRAQQMTRRFGSAA
jgi:hypothetical protein